MDCHLLSWIVDWSLTIVVCGIRSTPTYFQVNDFDMKITAHHLTAVNFEPWIDASIAGSRLPSSQWQSRREWGANCKQKIAIFQIRICSVQRNWNFYYRFARSEFCTLYGLCQRKQLLHHTCESVRFRLIFDAKSIDLLWCKRFSGIDAERETTHCILSITPHQHTRCSLSLCLAVRCEQRSQRHSQIDSCKRKMKQEKGTVFIKFFSHISTQSGWILRCEDDC